MRKKILIIGSARHGKDTVAEFIKEMFGFTFESSSVAASRIFLYDALKGQYGYDSPEACFNDRVNKRKIWHDLICEYNKDDKARLAKEIMKNNDIYVGMRSGVELEECIEQEVFDLVIGVINPNQPIEDKSSFDICVWKASDIIISNGGTLADLKRKTRSLWPLLHNSKKDI